jgi:hypothetical protein
MTPGKSPNRANLFRSSAALRDEALGETSVYRLPHVEAHCLASHLRSARRADAIGAEIETSEYRPSGSLRRCEFRNGADLTTSLDPATGYLDGMLVTGDVSPSGVEMETDIAVDANAGGRRPP